MADLRLGKHMIISEMSYKGGILVLRRVNYLLDDRYKAVNRIPASPWTHEEVLEFYRGIEGEPWPLDTEPDGITLVDGLAPIEQYESVLRYYEKASGKYRCDILYIQFPPQEHIHATLSTKLIFLGYDYGFYYSEFNYYSVVFHEIIYGAYNELKSLSKYLNPNLLLSTSFGVETVERARKRLLEDGYDLEVADTDEAFQAIAVYTVKLHEDSNATNT